MNRTIVGAALLALLCFASGCGFDLGFQLNTQPPITTVVTSKSIKISEGIAVGVTILDGDEPIEQGTLITFAPADTKIIDVAPTETPDRFVVVGMMPGKTTVNVFVDGDVENTIAAEVIAQ
jgi:hypothetical protein